MFDIYKYYKTLPKYEKIVAGLIDKSTYLFNAATNIQKLILIDLFQKTNKTIIVTYPNIYQATIAYNDMLDLTEADQISFFPVEDMVASEFVASSNTYRLDRIRTIYKLIKNIPQIVITTPEGITRNVLNTKKLQDAIISLKQKEEYGRDKLIEDLIMRGYQKASFVETPGTFSIRGSVVDVYSIHLNQPIRIDFFDNEVDSIKLFDVTTQRSIQKLEAIDIYPFFDIYYYQKEISLIKERILKDYPTKSSKIEKVLTDLENYQNLDMMYLFLPYIDENYQSFESLVVDKYLAFCNFTHILEKENQIIHELASYAAESKIIIKNVFLNSINEIIQFNEKNLFFETFSTNYKEIKADSYIDLKTSNNIDYSNYLLHMIEEYKINPKTYLISHIDEAKLRLVIDLLENNQCEYYLVNALDKIKKNKINLLVSLNSLGFIDYELNLEVITPKQFAKTKVFRIKEQLDNSKVKIYSKDDLNIGDYVVHVDYGIGRYLGIKMIENRGIKNDYLMIEYANNGKLYIPVDKIYRIQKYLSSFDKVPRLSDLNGKEWKRKKERVKEKLINVAKDLIKIQAKREVSAGYIYAKDSEEQLKMENDFDYIETPDQIKAINEVKKDMESSHPVDRLICGDVGFGKTEVALRAAFKAVDNGKQVAILAPTTVLARQHYYTFKERLEKYGVRVDLLNRFTSTKDTKKILGSLKTGYTDILVGTHRILSDDVVFKNIGLLVIDEEQRFGVMHKEQIKKLKANIDVIYLSATPIPRTLQMSLSGLRDMSLIETPPVNRKNVQTYVLKYNDSVIREAIYREMSRGGQTFYLLNRIEKLEDVKDKIKRLVPFAKVAIIHGKMDKEKIEETLISFIDNKYDVLVCTTIVETGMDIPNANTLIIERADTLGLAQLYQIRGRVGRSEQLAYAYLMYNDEDKLNEVAKKRLNTIKEFTALGSGYKVAMRDLSIRGAGDILGSEQSGFIDDVGIDLYLQMLEEAIEEEKGLKKQEQIEKKYNLAISKTVSDNYVDDDTVKIAIHEEISKIYSKEQAENIIIEFSDRFGKLSDELKAYIYSKYLETLLKQNDVESYNKLEKTIIIVFSEKRSKELTGLSKKKKEGWIISNAAKNTRYDETFKLKYAITIPIDNTKDELKYLFEIIDFFESL